MFKEKEFKKYLHNRTLIRADLLHLVMSHDHPTHKTSLGEICVRCTQTCIHLARNDPDYVQIYYVFTESLGPLLKHNNWILHRVMVWIMYMYNVAYMSIMYGYHMWHVIRLAFECAAAVMLFISNA